MIAHVTGRLAGKSPASCVIEVGGLGLRLFMSTGAISHLPAEGDEVTVFTHLHVREDELTLFGFESLAEQDLFEKLITVSGIGPKVALSALSAMSPDQLVTAISAGDDAAIATVPGIGRKTAQRMIVELKDRVGGTGAGARVAHAGSAHAEAADALASMGFSSAEVAAALKGYDGAGDAARMVQYALKRIGGGA